MMRRSSRLARLSKPPKRKKKKYVIPFVKPIKKRPQNVFFGVFVKTLTGKVTYVWVSGRSTIRDVKKNGSGKGWIAH